LFELKFRQSQFLKIGSLWELCNNGHPDADRISADEFAVMNVRVLGSQLPLDETDDFDQSPALALRRTSPALPATQTILSFTGNECNGTLLSS
jgi:hypothetical protein